MNREKSQIEVFGIPDIQSGLMTASWGILKKN